MTLAGCAPHAECEIPAQTTYSCQPTTDRAAACVGIDDANKAFPIGCDVNLPACSDLDPHTARAYECVIGIDGKPDWYEPI
jgi:hypothetical protein